MRLTKIELHGYKQDAGDQQQLDADLIALVGPNEAGKSTVLDALEWLGSGGALDQRKVNRTIDPGSQVRSGRHGRLRGRTVRPGCPGRRGNRRRPHLGPLLTRPPTGRPRSSSFRH